MAELKKGDVVKITSDKSIVHHPKTNMIGTVTRAGTHNNFWVKIDGFPEMIFKGFNLRKVNRSCPMYYSLV